ncbi:hypothetical protein PG991_009218, partial [Apiospora marii]
MLRSVDETSTSVNGMKPATTCDGRRPTCGPCATQRRGCSYDVDEQKKLQARHANLDAFVGNLLNLPGPQACQLLHWWRASDGLYKSLRTLPDFVRETANASLKLPWHQISQWLPPLELVTRFVNAFFRSNNKMFHVFSENQIYRCLEAGYQFPDKGNPERKADVCWSMAVAAIGAKYGHGIAGMGAQYQQMLYDLACYHLEAALQLRPSSAFQIYILLCLYNITSNANVAITYIACSWLSTLPGVVLDNDRMLSVVQLTDLEINTSNDIAETTHTELAKVALVTAKVTKALLASKTLTPESLQLVMADLQSWYSKLPSEIQLTNLMDPAQCLNVKWSGFHVHLLHLNGMMLCYHHIATQQSSSLNQDMCSLSDFVGQAVTAAATSARIFRLLFDGNILAKGCWLSTSLAYKSCVILLHCITQKQLDRNSIWDSELRDSALCLDVLEFCGIAEPVVAQL